MRLHHAVKGYKVNSRYGPRTPIKIPGGWTLNYHYGDDIAAPAGTPIVAPMSGVITRVGSDNNADYERLGIVRWPGLPKGVRYGGGNWVFIRNGNVEVRVMHLIRNSPLKVGTKVIAGKTVIGHVGTTGVSTGNHAHTEALVAGVHVDPQSEIPNPEGSMGVTHKLFQNREAGRKIKPGQSLYLVDKGGKKVDINPDVGLNQTIQHVRVSKLTPGDTISATLEWFRPGQTGVRHAQTSGHFPETVAADIDGNVFINVASVRSVSMGWFVHLRVTASRNNKSTGNVDWIDADVIHFD